MKKTLALIICVALVLAIMPTALAAGNGTSANPYIVGNETELRNAVTAEGYIRLNADITLTAGTAGIIEISNGQSVTLNLNGHTISHDSKLFMVTHGALTVTGTGTLEETEDDGYSPIVIKGSASNGDTNYSVVTIGENVTLRGWSGIMITQNGNNACGVVVNFNGKIISPAQSDHEAAGHGIYINGTINNTVSYPVINIESTAVITARLGCGIYAAGYAAWNIADGASITGLDSGIAIKAGVLNIGKATITCTGPNTAPTEGYSNGVNASGAALQIESNTSYAGNITININGASLISSCGNSVYEYLAANANDTKVNSLTVTDSNLTGTVMLSQQLEEKDVATSTTVDISNTANNFYENVGTTEQDLNRLTEVIANSEPSYVIVIPALVDFGTLNRTMSEQEQPFFVKIEDALLEDGAKVNVAVNVDEYNMLLKTNAAIKLAYLLYNVTENGTALNTNSTYATFVQGTAGTGETGISDATFDATVNGRATTNPAELTRAGAYSDTMTFDCTYTAPAPVNP